MKVEVVEEYLAYLRHEKGLAQRTIVEYTRDLKSYLIWCNNTRVVPLEATPHETRRYVRNLSESERAKTSIARSISALKTFYKWAVMDGYAHLDAAYYLLTPRAPKRLPIYLTAVETEVLTEYLQEGKTTTDLQRRVILFLLMCCGLRARELTGLKIAQIETERSGEPIRIHIIGKRDKERIVPCPEPLKKVLWDWIIHRRRLKNWDYARNFRRPLEYINSEYLIPGLTGGELVYTAVSHAVKNSCRRANIKVVTPHKLRHTFATNLHRNGVPITILKEALGHESISTTQIYTHIAQGEMEAAILGAGQ